MSTPVHQQAETCAKAYELCRAKHLPSRAKWTELRDLRTRALKIELRKERMEARAFGREQERNRA